MEEAMVLNNSLLKELMTDAMVYRGACSVLENATTPGYYKLDANTISSSEDLPVGWNVGILEVLKRDQDILHRITRIDGDFMLIRVRRSGTWKPFKKTVFASV